MQAGNWTTYGNYVLFLIIKNICTTERRPAGSECWDNQRKKDNSDDDIILYYINRSIDKVAGCRSVQKKITRESGNIKGPEHPMI